MYGYIRPDIGELRINEYRRFRSAYCGLCEALRQRYGVLARFLIGYDMTFLALLSLSPETLNRSPETAIEHSAAHSPSAANPLRKQPCICGMTELFDAADYTVILAYQKMQDDAADEKGFRSIRARLALRLLRSRCRKAAARQPKFDENVRQCLSQLAAVEERGSASLDEAADCFARLMAFPADRLADEMQRRLQSEILYHVGRTVYILDAADDYSDDRKNGRYNPLCLRFGSEVMTAEEKAEIRATLNLSLSRAMSAAALLPESAWTPIIENILSRGVPHVADAVFAGTWKKNRKNTEDL